MQNEVSFSIVIPCYNCANTVLDTLNSCKEQVFKNFEIIVVDDCSVDNTLEIINYFIVESDVKVKLIALDMNSGPSVCRNVGILNSNNTFIAFLDSDDIWHPCKLSIVSEFLTKIDVDMIAHSYTDNLIEFKEAAILSQQFFKLKRFTLICAFVKNISQTSCIVIKKDIRLLFNETMRYSEDYDLWLKIVNKGRVYKLLGVPMTLLSRPQLTSGGLSGRRYKMRIGEMKIFVNFCISNKMLLPLLPFLIFYSIVKHIRSEISFLLKYFRIR